MKATAHKPMGTIHKALTCTVRTPEGKRAVGLSCEAVMRSLDATGSNDGRLTYSIRCSCGTDFKGSLLDWYHHTDTWIEDQPTETIQQ